MITVTVILLCFCMLVTACHSDDALHGTYVTEHVTQYGTGTTDECDVKIVTEHNFNRGLFGSRTLVSDTKLQLTFHFNEPFSFSDITLYYDVKSKGVWDCSDNELTIETEAESIVINYIKSSASHPTERTMARELRKNIAKEYEKQVKSHLEEVGSRSCQIIEQTDKYIKLKPILNNGEEIPDDVFTMMRKQ